MNCSIFLLFFITFALVSVWFPLSANSELDEASQAINIGEYKNAITIYQQLIKKAQKKDLAELHLKLAQAYLKDQEQEKAFEVFLEGLKNLEKINTKLPTEEEIEFYNKALKTYLKQTGVTATETALIILQEYQPIVNQHPDYHLLNFLIAAAHANLNSFESFFNEFFSSFEQYSDHYMAYKTKAMLYVKLYEKEVNGENKKNLAQLVFNNTLLASEKYPQDSSLYKLLIAFSEDKKKTETVTKTIRKIINENIVVHRMDIHYYVKQTIEINQPSLGQEFLNKAKNWYQHSKAIDAAEDFLRSYE